MRRVPGTASVGTATADPNVAAMIQQAIATGSIDHVKSVAGAIAAQQAAIAAGQQPGVDGGQQVGITEDPGTGATDG